MCIRMYSISECLAASKHNGKNSYPDLGPDLFRFFGKVEVDMRKYSSIGSYS
jgi:hypothetical protein